MVHIFQRFGVLAEVPIKHPVTGKERHEDELKKLANDSLTLALGLDVQEITDFAAISESDVQKLRKISPDGTITTDRFSSSSKPKIYGHLSRLAVGVLL